MLIGRGQKVADYVGAKARTFSHKKIDNTIEDALKKF